MGKWVTVKGHPVFIENAGGGPAKAGEASGGKPPPPPAASRAVTAGPGASPEDPVPMRVSAAEGTLSPAEHARLDEACRAATTPAEQTSWSNWCSAAFKGVREIDAEGDAARVSAPMRETHKTLYGSFDKLPKYDGTAYRGLRGLGPDKLEALRHGGEVTAEAMSSYSRSPEVAVDFTNTLKQDAAGRHGVLFKFKGKAAQVAPFSVYKEDEAEVVHKKGTKFRVTKTYWAHAGDLAYRPFLVVEGEQT